MDSRGAIDGHEINGVAIGGGGFIEELTSTIVAGVAGSATVIARRIASGSTAVIISGKFVTPMVGAVSLAVGVTCGLVRRLPVAGLANVAIDPAAHLARRPLLRGSAPIDVHSEFTLSYHYLRPTERGRISRIVERRVTAIERQERAFAIHPEQRRFLVPREVSP